MWAIDQLFRLSSNSTFQNVSLASLCVHWATGAYPLYRLRRPASIPLLRRLTSFAAFANTGNRRLETISDKDVGVKAEMDDLQLDDNAGARTQVDVGGANGWRPTATYLEEDDIVDD